MESHSIVIQDTIKLQKSSSCNISYFKKQKTITLNCSANVDSNINDSSWLQYATCCTLQKYVFILHSLFCPRNFSFTRTKSTELFIRKLEMKKHLAGFSQVVPLKNHLNTSGSYFLLLVSLSVLYPTVFLRPSTYYL